MQITPRRLILALMAEERALEQQLAHVKRAIVQQRAIEAAVQFDPKKFDKRNIGRVERSVSEASPTDGKAEINNALSS